MEESLNLFLGLVQEIGDCQNHILLLLLLVEGGRPLRQRGNNGRPHTVSASVPSVPCRHAVLIRFEFLVLDAKFGLDSISETGSNDGVRAVTPTVTQWTEVI